MLHLASDAPPSKKKHACKLRYFYMSTFANRSIDNNPINPIHAAFSSDRGSKLTATIRVLTRCFQSIHQRAPLVGEDPMSRLR